MLPGRKHLTFGENTSIFYLQIYFRLSVSSDLRVDAVRDLTDIGAGKIEVHPLNKVMFLGPLLKKASLLEN